MKPKNMSEEDFKIKMKIYNKTPKRLAAHNVCMKIYRVKHIEDIKIKAKFRHLKNTYGITEEQYNKMFTNQQGCCAVCGKYQSEFKRIFDVDHDHITGKVRGLLCRGCNTGLGYYETKKELFENYLKQ